ncbi:MAG: hypothetical protein WBF29_02550, partial [Syntrophobacteria bacterium]
INLLATLIQGVNLRPTCTKGHRKVESLNPAVESTTKEYDLDISRQAYQLIADLSFGFPPFGRVLGLGMRIAE